MWFDVVGWIWLIDCGAGRAVRGGRAGALVALGTLVALAAPPGSAALTPPALDKKHDPLDGSRIASRFAIRKTHEFPEIGLFRFHPLNGDKKPIKNKLRAHTRVISRFGRHARRICAFKVY